MDVESPRHLEHLRAQPEIKAALLRERPAAGASECRFERSAKNREYWPPIEALAAAIGTGGRIDEACTSLTVDGQPSWLLVTALDPQGPHAIAVVSADNAVREELAAVLRKVTHDYWYGSAFFK